MFADFVTAQGPAAVQALVRLELPCFAPHAGQASAANGVAHVLDAMGCMILSNKKGNCQQLIVKPEVLEDLLLARKPWPDLLTAVRRSATMRRPWCTRRAATGATASAGAPPRVLLCGPYS
jgi:hypothetical protein